MIGRRSWDSRPLARLTEGGALEINSRVPHFESGATADALRRKIVATGAHSQLVAITIPAGTESGEDIHNSSDQAVFVVAGAGQAILNGHTESAGEHDALFIPAGTVANFINPGASDFKLLVAYSPPVTPEAGSTERSEGVNFYAIAQSSTVADEKDAEVGQAFPGGIKWTSWKSPTLRNVLFAADFSPASNTALPYAVSMARHYRSNLYVAHIIIPDVSGLIAPHLIDRVRTDLKAAATEKIEQLIRSAGAGDIKYEPLVAEGAIGDALLSAIRKKDVDLVVLGTHGRRRLRKLVLGSVAEEIFRLAPCPVLTIGPNAAGSEPLQFKNLVYPIELRGDVLKAAEYAISIAKEYNAALTLLSVIEEPSMSRDEKAWINVTAEHWFEDKIAPELGIANAHFAQKFGDPASAILQCAVDQSADLIVMNAQGPDRAVATLAPGIAHRVAAEASCPVLTIR